MENILTAEEFLQNSDKTTFNAIEKTMIEFAKLHVEAALKAVVKECDNEIEKDFINEELILNSYSLKNIK